MDLKIIERLSKIIKGEEEGSFNEQLLSEIYTEVNQIHQKQDEIMRILKEWQQKQKLH